MTKLNVVIPAVNVMVDGTTYRKVDRKAQAGDIVKATEERCDVSVGAFYPVEIDGDGDPYFYDDADDMCYTPYHSEDECEVYEALTPVPAESSAEITFDGAQYRKVDRSAREGDVIVFAEALRSYLTSGKAYLVNEIDSGGDAQIADDDGDEYDSFGETFDVYEKVSVETPTQTYREVKRKAAVGERIKIVNAEFACGHYGNGTELTVTNVARDVPGSIDHVRTAEVSIAILDTEYAVLEPVTAQGKAQPARLTVGDYARVIADAVGLAKIGAIIKITQDREYSSAPYDGEYVDGTATPVYFRESELEAATEAEFFAQRKPAEPVRLNVGDYAKIIGGDTGRSRVGDIVKITEDDRTCLPYKYAHLDGANAGWKHAHRVAPATAEEVSAAQAEAQRVAQRKQAIGPFAGGGFAQITNAKRGNATYTARENNGAYVIVTDKYGYVGAYALKVTLSDGLYGFCNADALRQITEAEYNAAIAPKPKFSVGDNVKLTVAEGKSPHYGRGNVKNGDVGTVSAVFSNRISVDFPKHGGWSAKPEELTKLSAEEAAAIEKEAQEIAKQDKIASIVQQVTTSGLPVVEVIKALVA